VHNKITVHTTTANSTKELSQRFTTAQNFTTWTWQGNPGKTWVYTLFIYKRNMISVTLKHSVTNLKFAIDPKMSKNEVAKTCVSSSSKKTRDEKWMLNARNVY